MRRNIRSRLFALLCAPLCLAPLALLIACNSPPATADLPPPTHTPGATSEPLLSSTSSITRATASPASTATPSPSPTPVELELSLTTYPLVKLPAPKSDVLDFSASVEGDPLARHAAERAQHFPDSTCSVAGNSGYCARLGDHRFAAWIDGTGSEAGMSSLSATRNR